MYDSTGQEYAAKVINTKQLSARGRCFQLCVDVDTVFLVPTVGSLVGTSDSYNCMDLGSVLPVETSSF